MAYIVMARIVMVLMQAHKSSACDFHVYVASAQLENYVNKVP